MTDNNLQQEKKYSLQKIVAEAFLIFLPLRMISVFFVLTEPLGKMAESLSFIFHVLGLVLLITSNNMFYKDEQTPIVKTFLRMTLCFSIISLVMMIYIDYNYGTYNGESPVIASVKTIICFIQYALIFIYSKEVFRCLDEDKIIKCLVWATRIPLTIGFLQIAELRGFPVLNTIYYFIADFFRWKIYPDQIALTFMEPSWAAMFIGIIVIPLHMSRLIRENFKNKKIILELMLWLPVILMTKSTTAYLLTFSSLGLSFVYAIFKSSVSYRFKIFSLIVLIAGFVFMASLEYADEFFGFNFAYRMQDKVFDIDNNRSTSSRTILFFLNWEVFKQFPIFGCGNGLQGYFFRSLESLPKAYQSLSFSENVYDLLNGVSSSVPNGQLFLPGILSGYGLFGIILFLGFLLKSLKMVIKNLDRYGCFGIMYILSLFSILVSSLKSEFIGVIYIWFVFSIPYAVKLKKKDKDEEK
ncbi:O-antigen ligase family protein [bacterium]|nr:O-antigen ligase family protein [bacterium]